MAGRICAICRRTIGGPDGRDNVAVVRWVQLTSGQCGWIAMHVRCAGAPLPGKWAAKAATAIPPGMPLQLPMMEETADGHGMA